MKRVTEKTEAGIAADATLTLPFDLRQKSRLRAELDSGEEVAVLLPRGTTLNDGMMLRSEDGFVVQVRAAPQMVSTLHCTNPVLFARACYHLGNRHVPLQIGDGWLRYEHDHVLDQMLNELGLSVSCESSPFEPEPGAYHSHAGHSHSHPHGSPT